MLTLRAPFVTATFSVMLLGPLHVLLAVRYLSGRVAGALPGSTGWLLAAFVAVMALTRAVSSVAPHLGHQLELVGGMAGIGAALVVGLGRRLRPTPRAIHPLAKAKTCSSFAVNGQITTPR